MRLYKQLATKNECYQRDVNITPCGLMLHSTGSPNPNLRRYVQPDDGRLGVNPYANSMNEYRPGGRQVCPHGFIGKLADGSIASYQILPWAMMGWHAGGSANRKGYIGVEICEDGLTDPVYFGRVYREAVELFAHLSRMYGWNPLADGVIIDHKEGHARGIASNHGDVAHWFSRHGKTMNDFRADVAREMNRTEDKEEPDDMTIEKLLDEITDEQAYELMIKANRHAGTLPEPLWSQVDGHWKSATERGLTDGTRPQAFMTRCEVAALEGRREGL